MKSHMLHIRKPALLIDMMNTILVPKSSSVLIYQTLLKHKGIFAGVEEIRAAFQHARQEVEMPLLTDYSIRETERQKWTRINSLIIKILQPNCTLDAPKEGEWLFEQLMGNPTFYYLPEAMQIFLMKIRNMGYHIVGASNQEPRLLRSLLAAFDLLHAFDTLAISDELGYAKPNPRFFIAAINLSHASLERSAFMGNNPLNDMAGAKSAGISLRILLDYKDELPNAPPYIRVTDPNQALPYLHQLLEPNS